MIRFERDMSEPMMKWLNGFNFVAYAEFPNYNTPVDIVGIKMDPFYTVAIELKKSLTKGVVRSAILNQTRFNESWCLIPTTPRDLSVCKRFGIGVFQLINDSIVVVLDAKWNEVSSYYINKNSRIAQAVTPGGTGGVPCTKGVGPAQDVAKRIDKYRQKYPKATWKELFENIPNHYYSANSMYGAMRILKERQRLKELER